MKNTIQQKKNVYFNIPNIMGYVRILLIPVFLYLYFHAEQTTMYIAAMTVLAISYLTDFLDGKIARKFNMVTDFGKALDPVADKLTQAALFIALTTRFPSIITLLFLFGLKEIYMGAVGLVMLRKKMPVQGAQRFGKIGTAVLDVTAAILLLVVPIPVAAVNILLLCAELSVVLTWFFYLMFHVRVLRKKEKQKIKKWKMAAGAGFVLLYILLGAMLPYTICPKVSEAYKKSFAGQTFTADSVCVDRAAVMEDNEVALAERIRAIAHAEQTIFLSTFDFQADTSGTQMLAALKAAADRGVEVRILVDGFDGWLHMESEPLFYALAACDNVQIKRYNPVNVLLPWKAFSRMHDKYLIVDKDIYILGGRNTFDYFLGGQEGYKNADRDIFVYNTGKLEQSSLLQIASYAEEIWEQDYCKNWHDEAWNRYLPCVPKAEKELADTYAKMQSTHPDWFAAIDYGHPDPNTELAFADVNKISLISNPTGLYSKEPTAFYALTQLMARADKEVMIHTPYVIANDFMYRTFADICKDGTPVTLMTNSASNNGNPFGAVDYALHKNEILDTGLHVLEYDGGVSYHAKTILIDDEIAIVGSFNMDMKSVYQDTELMLVVDSKELAADLKEILNAYQKEASAAERESATETEFWQEEVPLPTFLLRCLLRVADPWVRYLF